MGKTSYAVKDRWNAKTYDTITIRVKKGMKKTLADRADSKGKSLNGYVVGLIEDDIKGTGE